MRRKDDLDAARGMVLAAIIGAGMWGVIFFWVIL